MGVVAVAQLQGGRTEAETSQKENVHQLPEGFERIIKTSCRKPKQINSLLKCWLQKKRGEFFLKGTVVAKMSPVTLRVP